ncbi:MAG: hypothetical protein Kow0029_11900 [Candidatus Rifleibacteriota bacterium]
MSRITKLRPNKKKILTMVAAMAALLFIHRLGYVHGYSSHGNLFKRLDFLPAKPFSSIGLDGDKGRYFLTFNQPVKANLVTDSHLPLFYVDFLGARIEADPFVMNFPHGPAKMVRLTQISDSPEVVRATFFLRRSLCPKLKEIKNGLEISFSDNFGKAENEKVKKSFSLIPPLAEKTEIKISEKAVSQRNNKPLKVSVNNEAPVELIKELARHVKRVVHFRDPVLKQVTLNFEARDPIEAIEKISEALGLVFTEEDGEFWISDSRNPLLRIPESYKVEGVDFSNLSLGDVLRALGQIAEINIVLDESTLDKQNKNVKMYLEKMSIRRAIETLLDRNNLTLDEIDDKTLLVISKKKVRELEGKVVSVYSPQVPLETITSLLDKALSEELKKRHQIQKDLGNLIFIGDKSAVDEVKTIAGSIEKKLLNAGEGTDRKYFQPINTKPEELISLVKEAISENEDVKLAYDKRTDMILLIGSEESTSRTLEIMKKLDKPVTMQALINIRLIEVTRTNLEELGIKLPSTLGTTSDIGNSEAAHFIIPAELVGLLQNTNANTLANPTIRCMDKEESSIDITEQIPIKNTVTEYLPVASASLAARTTDNWTTSETGIKMKVKPLIHTNNEVTMEIDIDQTELVQLVEGHPWTSKRQIKTKVRMKDQETIVIGGLISKKKNKTRKPVPFLSKIPLLRKLIRNVEHRSENEERKELVVLISPKIVPKTDNSVQRISLKKD